MISFLVIYIAISTNLRKYETYKYQKRIWTPIGNESIQNTIHMEEMFPLEIGKATFENQEKYGFTYTSDFIVMVEAKPQRDGSRTTLLTKEHF
jgi:hypothetical protein